MGLRNVLGDVVLASAARGTGTYVSGPIANPGTASDVVLLVHATASSGTPTLDASLEESDDNENWSAVTGSAITQLTAAGNRHANARVTKSFVRVTSAVAGTTPSVTYRAAVLVVPE